MLFICRLGVELAVSIRRGTEPPRSELHLRLPITFKLAVLPGGGEQLTGVPGPPSIAGDSRDPPGTAAVRGRRERHTSLPLSVL